jgi:Fe-S cluster assembly protein SufD
MSALQRLLDEFATLGDGVGATRQATAQRLRSVGLPQRSEENWRYANLRALDKLPSFLPVGFVPGDTIALPPSLPAALPGFLRLVLVDGQVHHGPASAAEALQCLVRSGAPAQRAEAGSDQRLGLIATLFASAPVRLALNAPIALEIVSLSSTLQTASYLDLCVDIAPGIHCKLVERHLGGAEDHGLVCMRLAVNLAAGAQLRHQRLFAVSAQTLLLDTLQATLATQAAYQLCQIAAGGSTARSTAEVRLQGAHATLDWQALAAGSGPQVNDTMLTVLHEAAGTRSEQLFRGIANGGAHVACNADTRVTKHARGARVSQSLRGLLDGAGAEINLRPQLTIDTDDIQARHGATTGKLDENLLFYLLSRGLGPEEARALLKSAFLAEVLKAIEPEALRRDAQLAIDQRLAGASLFGAVL